MPVTQSNKPSQTVTPVQLLLTDFSGGLNADMANHPLALAENELADILNFKYVKTPKGVKLKMRDGLTKQTVSALPGAIKDLFYYVSSAGNEYVMAVADSDLNSINSGVYTKVGDLASTRGRMCQFNEKLVIADGGTLKYWDGSTFDYLYDSSSEAALWDNLTNRTEATTSYMVLKSTNIIKVGVRATPTAAYSVSRISFILSKIGSPTGNAAVKIYDSAGTSLVATSDTTLDVSTLESGYYGPAVYNFDFNTPVSLAAATQYSFVIEYSGGDDSNYVCVVCTTTVTKGAWFYISSWSTSATYSVNMSIYTSAPNATFVIQKQDRIYCNDSAYPNRLYYCNANDPNDWSTEDGGGYIIFEGHYKISGLIVFYDEIYIFCDFPKAVYRMTGDSPTEYVIKKLFVDVTAISQDAIQNVGTDLLFHDTRGTVSLKTMMQYGDIEKAIVSKNIKNTYILPYSSQITGKCEEDNQYWVTTTGQYAAVYDVELGIWTIYKFELGTGVTITALANVAGATAVGSSDGHYYYLDYAGKQDNSTDFSLLAKFSWHDFGTIQLKTARFADSLLISSNQETYDLEIYTDFNEATVKKTLSMVSLSKNGAFHSPYCGNINAVSMKFNQIQLKLNNIASGTGPHWLDRAVIEANIMSSYT